MDAIVGQAETCRPAVELHTDGACRVNPGPGGWAYLLRHPATGRVMPASDGDPRTTNNRMELTAVIRGLEALTKPSTVRLHSDSKYVVDGITEWMARWRAYGWRPTPKAKQPVKNDDLWRQVWDLSRRHDVTAVWVRGHDGHPENELCDRLATAAADRAALLPPPPLPAETKDGLFDAVTEGD